MAIRFVVFLLLYLIHTAVSQVQLTSDVPTNPICPNERVVFTCIANHLITLRWLLSNSTMNEVLVNYTNTSRINAPMFIQPSISVSLDNVQQDGNEFNFASTLDVNNVSVLGSNEVICDGGGPASADRQTVQLRFSPVAPSYNCTLPGDGMLRLSWTDTGDAVQQYLACSCIGVGCSCVPSIECGNTNMQICTRDLAAGQVQSFSFTAVNCDDQTSSASILTTLGADVPDAPVFSQIHLLYDQRTGGLKNIAVTWNTVDAADVAIDCMDEIGLLYGIGCGSTIPSVIIDSRSASCNGGTCQYESPASTGCTLSLSAENAIGKSTTSTSNIPNIPPLTVEVSGGRVICSTDCEFRYGTDPSNLITSISSNLNGFQLSGLNLNITYYYAVTAVVDALEVEVEGSFQLECDCLDLSDKLIQINSLLMCSSNGGTLPDAICNGMVTYTGLATDSGKATYRCNNGYDLLGDETRACQGDGSWSGTPPRCEKAADTPDNLSTVADTPGNLSTVADTPGNLSTAEVVVITVGVSVPVSFTAGGLIIGLIVHCYHLRKGKYISQPTPLYEDIPLAEPKRIELKENPAYISHQ